MIIKSPERSLNISHLNEFVRKHHQQEQSQTILTWLDHGKWGRVRGGKDKKTNKPKQIVTKV